MGAFKSVAFLMVLCICQILQVDSFFSARDAGSGKRAVQQVKEKIQMNIDWLDKYERSITKWLEDHA